MKKHCNQCSLLTLFSKNRLSNIFATDSYIYHLSAIFYHSWKYFNHCYLLINRKIMLPNIFDSSKKIGVLLHTKWNIISLLFYSIFAKGLSHQNLHVSNKLAFLLSQYWFSIFPLILFKSKWIQLSLFVLLNYINH